MPKNKKRARTYRTRPFADILIADMPLCSAITPELTGAAPMLDGLHTDRTRGIRCSDLVRPPS
jgi:hypothetical protein